MMIKGIELRDYQEQILKELASMPAIGLFIKTGGGKTITSIERALRNGTSKLLVICPQKIISQWWGVLENTTDYSVLKYKINAVATKKNKEINEFAGVKNGAIVINYDIVHKIDLDFINEDYTIILDESHKIKNNFKTDRKGNVKSGFITHKILELGERTPYKIILTATPAEKKYGGYIDYYTQLKFLGYIDYSERLFKNRYCLESKLQRAGVPFPIETITGYRMELIDSEIKPILKATCRFYAPKYGEYEPQKIKIAIEKAPSYSKLLSQRVYEEIVIDNSSAFRIAKKTLTGGKITGTDDYKDRFVYIDNTNKADWLEEFLSNTDDVVSVLYNYNVEKDMIIEVCKNLKKKFVVINGDTVDKPAELKKDFEVLVGQYRAVGESLDGLQHKCHIMVYYSMPDSSEQYVQSLGRIDRIGQTEMPIYYHLIMVGTIDEKVYEMVESKVEFTTKDLDMLTTEI